MFTCITEVSGVFHLSQHDCSSPDEALREHVAVMPYDDATGPFDEELDWLQQVSGGMADLQLIPVSHCPGTWLWQDGARRDPQYITYLVRTEIPAT